MLLKVLCRECFGHQNLFALRNDDKASITEIPVWARVKLYWTVYASRLAQRDTLSVVINTDTDSSRIIGLAR